MACGFPILHLGLCLCTRNRISTCPLCWDGWASTRRIINWNSPINVLDGRLGLRLHLFRARRNGNIGRRIWLNVLVVESHASYDAVSAWRKVPSMQGSHQCSNRWAEKKISFFTGLWHPEVFPSMKGSHQCSNRYIQGTLTNTACLGVLSLNLEALQKIGVATLFSRLNSRTLTKNATYHGITPRVG